MFEFYTFIKNGDYFYRLDDEEIQNIYDSIDWEYVEGGYEIYYDDKEIYGLNVIDDVNWFWALFAHNFQDYFEKGKYSVTFTHLNPAPDFHLKKLDETNANLSIYSSDKVFLDINIKIEDLIPILLNSAIDYFKFEKKYKKFDVEGTDECLYLIYDLQNKYL